MDFQVSEVFCYTTVGGHSTSHLDYSLTINNKEEKRVSNALYTPYKMFSESHAPGIQKSTNQSARFTWYIVGVASSAS